MFYHDLSEGGKKYIRGLGMLLALGLTLSSFAFAYSYWASGANEWRKADATRQISVSGQGKKAMKSDIAIFNVGVSVSKEKVKDTQAENNKISEEVTSFLKENGIADADLKTVGYSIYPQYQYYNTPVCAAYSCPPPKPPTVVSYQVTHTLEVKVRNISKVDALIDGVVTKGANELGSINFTVDDEEGVKAEARRKAIEDAQEKAEVLAKSLGVRLGRIINFSESTNGGIYYATADMAYGRGGGGGSPSVQPGEQEIQSNVVIMYEIK